MKHDTVPVQSGTRMFYVEPGSRGVIFEADTAGVLVPAKDLTGEQEKRLRFLAEARPPSSSR
jgi:hypothetical protein